MKKLDLEFKQKPGLALALELLNSLPSDAPLQEAIRSIGNANGAIFEQMPLMVITTQRAMSAGIREAADEFKIPVYYRDCDTVRHYGVLPLDAAEKEIKQMVYSRSDFTPNAETVFDNVNIFENLEFQARPLRNQNNAYLILVSVVTHNPKVQLLLRLYGYQALRLEIAKKSKWLVGVPEIKSLFSIGIDTRLPVPTDEELELFLQGKLQPQNFTLKWDREMALKETKED